MDRIRLLLNKYPEIQGITVQRNTILVTVADSERFIKMLEQKCFNVKQVRDNNIVDLSFGIAVHTNGLVEIPHTSLLSFFRNLLQGE